MYIYCATEHRRDRVFLPPLQQEDKLTHSYNPISKGDTCPAEPCKALAEEDSEQTLGGMDLGLWEYRGAGKGVHIYSESGQTVYSKDKPGEDSRDCGWRCFSR